MRTPCLAAIFCAVSGGGVINAGEFHTAGARRISAVNYRTCSFPSEPAPTTATLSEDDIGVFLRFKV